MHMRGAANARNFGVGWRLLGLAAIACCAGYAAADEGTSLIARATLRLPPGFVENRDPGTPDTRDWQPSHPDPDHPSRVVLLERERESWDDARSALERLARLLRENCPRAVHSIEPLAAQAPVEGAARGELVCPNHPASGRGMVVVEDVLVIGTRLIVIKVAFDYPSFTPGVRPLTRTQRALAHSILDSLALPR